MQQFLNVLLYILLSLTSLFLICLILIQRGKGGGLAGAFGGAGGSSAFGTKAGDVFTRVTMIAAAVWIALNMLLVVVSSRRASAYGPAPAAASKSEKSELVPPGPVPIEPGKSIQVTPGATTPKDEKAAKTSEPAAASTKTDSPPPAIPSAPDASKTVPK